MLQDMEPLSPQSSSAAIGEVHPRLSGSTKPLHILDSWKDSQNDRISSPPPAKRLRTSQDSVQHMTPPQFQPSLVNDKYLLLEQVEGSSLNRCVDIRTREEYVCKVVSRDCSALLAAHYRLDGHPHVNPLREVLIGDKKVYLVFPRSHSDLHSYVRTRKRIRESEARRLFKQMAETVRACHENGIVLRDLKLRKFVFEDQQRTELKLETLEDAVVLDEPDSDLLQDKRGCPAYVSPEILRAHQTYSGRAADMWSLGVILYTMLVGRYPFNDSEHASLFAKISRGYFAVPECLSSRAKCLIRSLLRREPSERLAAADALRHPWLARDQRTDAAPRAQQAADRRVPDVRPPPGPPAPAAFAPHPHYRDYFSARSRILS